MNRFLILFLTVAAAITSGCRKKNYREIPYSVYVNIPAGLNVLFTHHFPIDDVPGMPNETGIISVQPTMVRLVALNGGNSNLDFIQHAYIDVVTDSLRAEMAYRIDAPFVSTSVLDMLPSIIDMKQEAAQESFDMELKLVHRGITSDVTYLRIDFNLRLEEE